MARMASLILEHCYALVGAGCAGLTVWHAWHGHMEAAVLSFLLAAMSFALILGKHETPRYRR